MNLRSTGFRAMDKTEVPKGGTHVEPGEHLSASTLLTGQSFWDETVFHEELERFYFRSWLNVGRSDQIPNPGDFFVREIGNESLLFIRGDDRNVRGFYNVCRHRGTRIVGVADGEKLGSLVCPYHAWTYSVEGKLVGAPHTEPLVDFRKEDYGLRSFRTGTWGGFVWANLDDRAPDLPAEMEEFFSRFRRFAFEDLRLGARKTYEVEANWKILGENYSECYHCAPIHPELNRITHYTAGAYARSEEHTSELQSQSHISYAVFCLKKKKKKTNHNNMKYIYIKIKNKN